MIEFVPLSAADLLGPAFLAIGLLAAGAAAIVLLELVALLVYGASNRLARKLQERHAGP
jgi:hypothetical protein